MKEEYDFSKAKRGAVVSQKGKIRINIYIDNDVLEEFRKRTDEALPGGGAALYGFSYNYLWQEGKIARSGLFSCRR